MIKRLLAALSVNMGKSEGSGELLRRATQHKANGDLESAVSTLRAAYAAIAKGSTVYPMETFLRLPLYLQQAGKGDEAWREFNRLLADGYPNQTKKSPVTPMEHSRIYDKMRLFLEREGRRDSAIAFGIASHLSWAVGLKRQRRDEELEEYCSPERVSNTVARLLKKTDQERKQAELVNLVQTQLADLKGIDLAKVMRSVHSIVT